MISEVATGKTLGPLSDPNESVSFAAFSPDGREVVTAGTDSFRVHIYGWERFAPVEDLIALANSRVKRKLTVKERQRYLQ